ATGAARRSSTPPPSTSSWTARCRSRPSSRRIPLTTSTPSSRRCTATRSAPAWCCNPAETNREETSRMNAPDTPLLEFKNHDLAPQPKTRGVRYEKRPARKPDGSVAPGLYNAWITLDNPAQYNSYTTDMVKAVILAFKAASNARDVNCIVFTGAGDKAFCTGG